MERLSESSHYRKSHASKSGDKSYSHASSKLNNDLRGPKPKITRKKSSKIFSTNLIGKELAKME